MDCSKCEYVTIKMGSVSSVFFIWIKLLKRRIAFVYDTVECCTVKIVSEKCQSGLGDSNVGHDVVRIIEIKNYTLGVIFWLA